MEDGAAVESTESTSQETEERNPDLWDDEQPEEKEEPKEKPEAKKPDPEPKKETPEQRKRRLERVKIDGKDELVDVDDAIRQYSKNRAAENRLREANQKLKEAEEWRKDVEEAKKGNVIPFIKKYGFDPRGLGEVALKHSIEDELKDDKDRKIEELQSQLQAFLDEKEAANQEVAQKEESEKITHRKGELSKSFAEAMEDTALSKNPKYSAAVLREMAKYALAARSAGLPMPDPKELAAHAEGTLLEQVTDLVESLDIEDVVKIFGEKNFFKRLNKYNLDMIMKQKGMADEEPLKPQDDWDNPVKPKTPKEPRYIDGFEASKRLRERLRI